MLPLALSTVSQGGPGQRTSRRAGRHGQPSQCFSCSRTPGGYAIHRTAERVKMCRSTSNQFGSSKVPPNTTKRSGTHSNAMGDPRAAAGAEPHKQRAPALVGLVLVGGERPARDLDGLLGEDHLHEERAAAGALAEGAVARKGVARRPLGLVAHGAAHPAALARVVRLRHGAFPPAPEPAARWLAEERGKARRRV